MPPLAQELRAAWPILPNTTVLSNAQLQALWVQAGGDPTKASLAAAVAQAESGGNTSALNDNPHTLDYSVGAWQVNYFGNLLTPRSAQYGAPAQLLADPLAQAKAAVAISNNGQDFTPWSTYLNGAYLSHLLNPDSQSGSIVQSGTPVTASSSATPVTLSFGGGLGYYGITIALALAGIGLVVVGVMLFGKGQVVKAVA